MREALAEARALRRALQQAAEGDADGTGFRAGGPEDTDRGTSTGVRVDDLDAIAIERQAQVVSQGVMEALRALSNAGANARDIDELRQLAAGIRASDFSGNPDILAREARLALALAEQLELQLSRTIEGNADGIRGTSAEEIPEQHREIIADYYRRLGSADANE